MMSDHGELLAVGRLAGVFGVKGWLKLKSFTSPPENAVQYAPHFLGAAGALKPVEIVEHQMRPQGCVIRLRGIDDRSAAEALGRLDLWVPKAALPALDGDDYYWHQLIGLDVIGPSGPLGRVDHLMETGANDVLVVVDDHRERLIPYLPGQVIQAVDLVARQITVDWDPDF